VLDASDACVKSLFWRVFVAFWVALLAMAALSAFVTARNFMSPPVSEAERIVREAQQALDRDGLAGLREWQQGWNDGHDNRRILIFDEQRREISGLVPPLPGRGLPGLGFAPRRPPPGPDDAPWNNRVNGPGGSLFVIIDPPFPRGSFGAPFSGLERGLLIVLALLSTAAMAWSVAHSIGRPLRGLQSVSRRLAGGDLGARPDAAILDRKDEIGLLGRDFDEMAYRLSVLLKSREYLLRELSHEMRAPLARLRVALDLMDLDAGAHGRHLERISREADRLERLANGVLNFARIEQDARLRHVEPVDLVALSMQAITDVSFELKIPAHTYSLRAAGDATVRGDPPMLRVAIENLLRNAAVYAGVDRSIDVQLLGVDDRVRFIVRDHGPGVASADLPKLFQPFTHLDRAAQLSSGEHTGTGLGLAIVAQIAKLHEGSAKAENAEGGGLRVTIDLPAGVAAA
jgi:signal transduction histidine kinase